MATINSPISYRENSEASLDGRYGPWIGTPAQVHSQLLENEIVIVETLTIGIKANTTAPTVEYWYQGGTEMANLVPKYVCELTSELKDKLTNMPTIVLKENNIITIDNQDFILTPAEEPDPPAPSTAHDYYAGFASGTKSQFAAMTAEQLQASATGYDKGSQPTYTHAVGQHSIFYLMWRSGCAPQSGSLVSGGVTSPLTSEDFTDGTTFNTPHDPVSIDGVQYTVAAIRNTDFNPEDTFTVNF